MEYDLGICIVGFHAAVAAAFATAAVVTPVAATGVASSVCRPRFGHWRQSVHLDTAKPL